MIAIYMYAAIRTKSSTLFIESKILWIMIPNTFCNLIDA